MTIKELRQRSNQFVANLDVHIAAAVNDNNALTELNRKQMRESKLADGSMISRPYSSFYAFWKKTFHPSSYADGKVNLFLHGTLYKSLRIKTAGKEVYNISTDVFYAAGLRKKFGDYLGIAPENQTEAQRITGAILGEKYEKLVLA